MLPSTVPLTLTDFDLMSPRIVACSPIVSMPLDSMVPSTSPSIASSSLNLTVPLIETPRERRPRDLVGSNAPFDWGTGGGVAGVEACGSGLRVENIFIRKFLQAAQVKLILFRSWVWNQNSRNSRSLMKIPTFVDEEQVRKHLPMADLIPAMEKALIDFSAGNVTQPVRQVISVDPPGGFYGIMPALTPEGLSQKIVTFYPPNSEKGIPTHMALIVLNDPQTGTPLAVMDGRLITEMRTAAVSAAATKLLAPKDSKVLAILRSGVQARSQIQALRLVRNFEEIRVWSPNTSHAENFAQEIGARSTSAEEAVRDADVVVTVTSSKTPGLGGAWVEHGCHVNA